jgi:hypothetical protein
MEAIGPDRSMPAHGAIDRPRHANCEAPHAGRQPRGRIGFDQDVHVLGLHAEMQNPEAVVRRGRERILHRDEHALAPQRRQSCAPSHRDVHRMSRVVDGARPMADAAPTRGRLAPGATSATAPGREVKLELIRGSHRGSDWAGRRT